MRAASRLDAGKNEERRRWEKEPTVGVFCQARKV